MMKTKTLDSLIPSGIALRVLLRLFDKRVLSEADLSAALARHEARCADRLGLA